MATMTRLPLEFQDLLKSFNGQDLKYLIVGGWAVAHHGYHRYTSDIDFWIAVSSDNADRLIAALKEFAGSAPTKNSIIKQPQDHRIWQAAFESAYHVRHQRR